VWGAPLLLLVGRRAKSGSSAYAGDDGGARDEDLEEANQPSLPPPPFLLLPSLLLVPLSGPRGARGEAPLAEATAAAGWRAWRRARAKAGAAVALGFFALEHLWGLGESSAAGGGRQRAGRTRKRSVAGGEGAGRRSSGASRRRAAEQAQRKTGLSGWRRGQFGRKRGGGIRIGDIGSTAHGTHPDSFSASGRWRMGAPAMRRWRAERRRDGAPLFAPVVRE
jgi:hypothetical protein